MEWFTVCVGLAGGVLVSYGVGQSVLPRLVERSRNPELMVKLSLGGTVIASLPALLLSIVAGAPLGAAWGAVGMVLGVAGVFAAVLLAGTFAGMLLARLLTRPGA
jgi:hypothetical protein